MKKKLASLALIAAPMILLAGCSKPSEAEVHKKIVSEATKSGVDKATAEKAAGCMAPKMVDKLSASSLDTIIEKGISGSVKVKASDADAANKIIDDCQKEVMGG